MPRIPHRTSHRIVSHHSTSYHVTTHHTISYSGTIYFIYYTIWCNITSYHTISHHIAYHIASYRIISHHIASHHIVYSSTINFMYHTVLRHVTLHGSILCIRMSWSSVCDNTQRVHAARYTKKRAAAIRMGNVTWRYEYPLVNASLQTTPRGSQYYTGHSILSCCFRPSCAFYYVWGLGLTQTVLVLFQTTETKTNNFNPEDMSALYTCHFLSDIICFAV